MWNHIFGVLQPNEKKRNTTKKQLPVVTKEGFQITPKKLTKISIFMR